MYDSVMLLALPKTPVIHPMRVTCTATHRSLQPHLEEAGVITILILLAMSFKGEKTLFHHLSWELHSLQMFRNQSQSPHHSYLLPTSGNIWLWKENQHEFFQFNSHLINSNTYWANTYCAPTCSRYWGNRSKEKRPNTIFLVVQFHRKTESKLNKWLDKWYGVWLLM